MSSYEILFRPEIESDIKRLDKTHQERILTAIESRLVESPQAYGRPLGGNLKGLRRLRVGDYRIAYQVEGDRVVVWAIFHRKDIYKEISKRYGA